MTIGMPVLQIRHDQQGWGVAATWSDGHSETIGGFKNENEANEWIAKEFQAWLDEHEQNVKA